MKSTIATLLAFATAILLGACAHEDTTTTQTHQTSSTTGYSK